MVKMKGVGENIQMLLTQRGMTRKELAKKTHLTEAAISRYINGDREPKAITLSSIAMALEVSLDELMGAKANTKGELDTAMRLVARNADSLTPEDKEFLIKALVGV